MTTTKPGATTKLCPRCVEEIKAEARVCRYCHAQFVVEHHGYCAHCHAVVTLTEGKEDCPVCSGPLVDILVDSRLVETTPPPVAVQQAPIASPPLSATPTAATPAPPVGAPPPVAPEPMATAPVGSLRKAVVPSLRQWIGFQLTPLAAMGMIAMPFASAAFENLRINMEEGNGIIRQAHALGPTFAVIGIVIALLLPWRALPKTVGGSRLKARTSLGPFQKKIRAELHARILFRAGGFVARLAAVAVLWVACIALFAASSTPPAGWVAGTGTPVTWAILGLGAVASLLMLPFGRQRHVMLDDEGNFFAVPDEAARS